MKVNLNYVSVAIKIWLLLEIYRVMFKQEGYLDHWTMMQGLYPYCLLVAFYLSSLVSSKLLSTCWFNLLDQYGQKMLPSKCILALCTSQCFYSHPNISASSWSNEWTSINWDIGVRILLKTTFADHVLTCHL